MVSGKFRDFLKENLPFKMKIGLFPLLVSGLFFLATAAWILFEHVFLPWSPVSKDFIWAFLSTVVLYLLLDYGVSAIRKSEATLMESEKYISRILETNASGILVMDRKGVVTYANLEAASLLGALRSDIVGRNYREWPCEIRKTDGTSILDEEILFFRVADTGEALYGMELTVLRQDGTRLLLSVNVAPLVDGEGNISEMVASFSDVTASNEASRLHLKKLHLAAEQSPSGIAIADAAGRIEYGNPMFASVTGYLPEEFLNATKPCPTDISPQACREICDAIASGTEWEGEYWNRRKNGELYWESARLTPIRDQKGRVTNFLWVAQDVTEQRLAEDALRDTRERYQNLVEKIHDLVWEIDKDVSFTYISPKLSDLLGYEPEEVLGKTPFDLMPPPEAERVEVLFRPVVDGHLPFEHIESILRDKEGRDVIFTTSGVPYYGTDGSFRGWRGVSRDITRLKQDEEELRRSEEQFRQIFEQNEEAVVIFRAGTAEVLDANPAAIELYGYSLDEMREEGPNLFVGPGEQIRFFHEIRHISPGNPLEIEQCQHVRKDGTPIIVSIRGKSILLREGQVSYCTFRDITARVRAEEEAMARQAQLIHANRMTSLGTMVSGVAHEINNPNNLIMFNAPMIQAAWKDADKILEEYHREHGEFSLGGLPYSEMRKVVPKLVAGMSDSSARIRDIVEKLKNFARRDKENLECRIDLNEVVHASVSILNHEIARVCRDFRVDLAENLPMVKGCAQQLEQVMVNLIMNALQALPYNHKGIRILTSVNGETGAVEIRVRDEGIGISAEVMKHIAEPFFSTKLDSGGLGLGLSISASIVRDHNGTLDFESEFGKGTTVTLSFPRIDPAVEDSPKVSVPKYGR